MLLPSSRFIGVVDPGVSLALFDRGQNAPLGKVQIRYTPNGPLLTYVLHAMRGPSATWQSGRVAHGSFDPSTRQWIPLTYITGFGPSFEIAARTSARAKADAQWRKAMSDAHDFWFQTVNKPLFDLR